MAVPDSVSENVLVLHAEEEVETDCKGLSVKVRVAVWPDLRVLLSEVIEIVGATVSMLMES